MRTCHYCRKVAKLTRDHVVPIARGGMDKPWNCVKACRPCNEAKSSNMPTCTCGFCRKAVEKHPWAWLGDLRDKPDRLKGYPSLADRVSMRQGPTCPDCGEITMTPADCGWCRPRHAG